MSSQPVLVVTPTPTPTATPIPTASGGTVSVVENGVEWAVVNGDDITSIQPGSTGIFFIRDDALETTPSGAKHPAWSLLIGSRRPQEPGGP